MNNMTETPLTPANEFRWDTTATRALAALLIVNSHLESYYPVRALADGGLIGNLLFFLVSGLGLGLSARTGQEPFHKWYLRRLMRIYPAVWICLIPTAVLMSGNWQRWGAGEYFGALIWPLTGYHFLMRIIVYYVILYALLRWHRDLRWLIGYLLVSVVLAIACVVAFPPNWNELGKFSTGQITEPVKWTFYFVPVLAGAVLAKATFVSKFKASQLLAMSMALAIAYVGLKYIIVVRQVAVAAYPVLLFATVLFCVAITTTLAHPTVLARLKRVPLVWSAIAIVGAASLELYLIHMQLAHFGFARGLMFPLNLLCFLVVSITASLLAQALVSQFLGQRSKSKPIPPS